jgi:cytochrome oxidase assembly protein ShyY1
MAYPHIRYRTWAALILLAAMAAGFSALGRWQLDRAAGREAIKAAIVAGRSQAALNVTADTPRQDFVAWRPAEARGIWLPALTILLENRNYQGRPGYWIATPLKLSDPAGTAILVLRGWIPRPMGPGQALQDIPTPDGEWTVPGQLMDRAPRLFELWSFGDNGTQLPTRLPDAQRPLPRVQNVDIGDFARASGLKLVPVVLAQTAPARSADGRPDAADTLAREWPEPSVHADQNRGYALQWFGFASIAAIAWLLIFWRALRRRTKPDQL